MSSRHRRTLTGDCNSPAWHQVGVLAFARGVTPGGTKVHVWKFAGPESGRQALLTVHLGGERASREAGVAASLAASPGRACLSFTARRAQAAAGGDPGAAGAADGGDVGGRDGAGRHPPIQCRGWLPPPALVRKLGGAQGAELCSATPLPLATGGLPREPRLHASPSPFPSMGRAFCSPDAPVRLGSSVTWWIIRLNSSSWFSSYAGR